MPTDIDRVAEAADTLKQRMAAYEVAREADRHDAKEDRHRLAGFITGHEARIVALETEKWLTRGLIWANGLLIGIAATMIARVVMG